MVGPGTALSLTSVSLVVMMVKVDGMRNPRRWEVRTSTGRGKVVGIFASELWVG
jgi:hypothetical protein